MTRPLKTLVLAISSIGVGLAALAVWILKEGGAFTSVPSTFGGQCRTVALGGSSGDVRIDRQRGLAYLSVRDRDGGGSIQLLDLNVPEPAPRAAMLFDPADFRPVAVGFFEATDRPARLFVVSQTTAGAVVEIAEQGSSGFAPVTTVRDPAFTRPRAIAAAGMDQFYVVDDDAPDPANGGYRAVIRSLLVPDVRGTLVFHDGMAARIVARDLAQPSGVALGPDGSSLYVAEAGARALRIYERQPSGDVRLRETVALPASPARIDVDDSGIVWIAGQPKLLRYFAHARDAAERAPTQVWRFDPTAKDPGARLQRVYQDDGQQLSAGTAAAGWRGQFLIGALSEPKVLLCQPTL